jgi:6-phosphofructo-2-kinase
MSHLMGSTFSAFSAPASPRIKANEDAHSSENGHVHGPLPPPGAPALTKALNTLKADDSVPPRLPNGPQYDSPYSRSISSTAPTSPRM